MIKTNGAQNGRSGVLVPNMPVPARPIRATTIQQDSIAPSKLGNRNSPRLVISSVSGGVNTVRLSHCEGDRTPPCFFCDDLGGSICKGFIAFLYDSKFKLSLRALSTRANSSFEMEPRRRSRRD